jgi:5-deoxy-D-glucuronate isomerase
VQLDVLAKWLDQHQLEETNELVLPKGNPGTDTAELVISPEQAGWQYSGLHVANLSSGKDFSLELTGEEAVILLFQPKM